MQAVGGTMSRSTRGRAAGTAPSSTAALHYPRRSCQTHAKSVWSSTPIPSKLGQDSKRDFTLLVKNSLDLQ